MPRNTFNGAILNSSDVSPYYPSNSNFDHFVFQQVLSLNVSGPDNSYTLCAYAVFTATSGLPPVLIVLSPDQNGTGYKAPKGVVFANMKLDQAGLAALYPKGVNSNITLAATGLYLSTDYIQYKASSADNPGHDTTGGVPINPSPPA